MHRFICSCGYEPSHWVHRLRIGGHRRFAFKRSAVSASQSFLPQINARLAESGLPLISEIPADGLQLDPNQLAFVAEREHLLERAPDIQWSYRLETVQPALPIASLRSPAKNTQAMRLSSLTTHRLIPVRCRPYRHCSTCTCPCDICWNHVVVFLGLEMPVGGPRKPILSHLQTTTRCLTDTGSPKSDEASRRGQRLDASQV